MIAAPSLVSAKQLHALEGLPAPEAIARLAAVRDALASSNDPAALSALAKAIPLHVARLAPEVALLLADVTTRLLPHAPTTPRDIEELPDTRLRVTWLRVALQSAAEGAALAEALDEATLLVVLTGWPLDAVADPRALSGPLAFDVLAPLAAGDPDLAIRERALRLLAAPWLSGLSPERVQARDDRLRRALRDAEPRIAAAAIEAAALLASAVAAPARRWLVDLLHEPASKVPDATKAAALEALGPLAEASDIDLAIDLAGSDSLRFGPPVRRFLLEAHRHGVFLRDEHIDAALGLFDEHVAWTGEELVRVTYIARKALVRSLAELPANDERWIRRAAILAASLRTGAHRVLEGLLEQLDPCQTQQWPIAAAVLEAAAASPELGGEEGLLRFLDILPEYALPALRVKGGIETVKRLRHLVLDAFTPRPLRSRAMDVLWALEPDRRQLLSDLAHALPPHESGLLDGKYLTSRDSTAAELLRATYKDDAPAPIPPIERLKVFCESGDIRFSADVTRLFREVFRGYVRKALEGDFTIKRLLLPELEQLVFRYGRHLVKDGRSVRRFVEPSPETGRDLVLLLVTDWLDDRVEPPSDPVVVALLETAARHKPDGAYLRLIEPFWRRGDANVKRAAIEALVTAGAGARGLELSLGRLAADAQLDSRILTQALAAVRTLRAGWAEPIVRGVLERREMAVKKEAAEALAEIGTGTSVPALVGWIGRHDNEGFRALLLRALEKSAGPALVPALVTALERVFCEEGGGEARTKELLLDALSRRIPLAGVMRLAAGSGGSEGAAHRAIVDACLDGKVVVVGATVDELAAHLHRAKLRRIEPKEDPAKRLRIEGFSPDAARELVALRRRTPETERLEPPILAVVRGALADWIAWASSAESDIEAPAVALLVDAADRSHAEHLPQLLTLIERWAARLDDTAGIVAFFERALAPSGWPPELLPLRMRAATIVRGLRASPGVGGPRRWRLLGRLGAVRTAADVDACLAACDGAPSVAAESLTLLAEAFAIPLPRPSAKGAVKTERELELEALHEEAAVLYRESPEARSAWTRRVATRRPIDLPPVAAPPEPARPPPFKPASEADLAELLAALEDETLPVQERERAAVRILEWPDAATRGWRAVLRAWIHARLNLEPAHIERLASALETWPDTGERERLVLLVSRLGERQRRVFVPAWIEQWQHGGPDGDLASELLRASVQERLLPFVIARARRGDFTSLRLLRRSVFSGPAPAAAFEALLALAREQAPLEAQHLLSPETPVAVVDDSKDPVDPIEAKTLDELVALLAREDVEKGLTVRAVHALARRFGDRAIEPLARFAVDRRAQVRSAALRALRTVASKERTLEVTALALKLETRRDVALSLMASLGHGRHEPALPILIERLTDRDGRVRQGARDALLAWGREIIPALRHAARRARPDRRPIVAALIAELG